MITDAVETGTGHVVSVLVRPRSRRRDIEPLAARRLVRELGRWARGVGSDWPILMCLVAVAGTVHAIGMTTYPDWVADPGTYLSQAWSVQYQHQLSPYSYFYDHAPGGWIQLAAWSMLTNGFGRHQSAMDFGNECMLLSKVLTCTFMYALARRGGIGQMWSAGAVLLYALNPLALHYTRITYLDNLATPWLLLAFVLAASPRRHLLAVAGSSFAFANAVLTKETMLVTLPALVLALWQNSDRRTRTKSVVVAAGAGSWLLLYPALAMVKGEFFPGPDHNSLLGTAVWQLNARTPSGSVLQPGTVTRTLVTEWLALDWKLLTAGSISLLIGLAVRRLRPWSLAAAGQSVVLFTGGYVPFMQVINLLPWAALLIAGVIATAVRPIRRTEIERWLGLTSGGVLIQVIVMALVGIWTLPTWEPNVRRMMTTPEVPPLRQAENWVADNVPRGRVVVVHDALWTDLVAKMGFAPENVIIVFKVDTDPAVAKPLKRIDYLVLPDYYYVAPEAKAQYPTVLAARQAAYPVAHFGTGLKRAVTVYRVSSGWSPKD